MTIDEALHKLEGSAFRAKFHLTDKDRKYISEKGLDTIRKHAVDFVKTRLAPSYIPNDGKQTPMCGHPVFIAQHACACCCRIVNLLMAWIAKELKLEPALEGSF